MKFPDKTVLYGGTFDPFHNAHKQIICHLSEQFGKVLVVPSKLSPFKIGKACASDADRLKMLRLGLEGEHYPNVTISTFELESDEKISYSFLTAEHYYRECGGKIYYAIGSEMLRDLDKWERFDKLAQYAAFYVIGREGFDCGEQLKKHRENGAEIILSDFVAGDVSSSEIKVALAFGKEDGMMPEETERYIKANGLYRDYDYIVSRYGEFRMTQQRIDHTYRACKAGIRLAKIHNVDVEKTVTALLLHDIGKYVSKEELEANYGIKGIRLDPQMPAGCVHAVLSCEIACHCFDVEESEILKAILSHTTGATGMDRLAMVVAIADYIEEGRAFANLDAIREQAKTDLEKCMLMVLKNTIDYLHGKEIYRATYEAYEYFKGKNAY